MWRALFLTKIWQKFADGVSKSRDTERFIMRRAWCEKRKVKSWRGRSIA